MAMRGSLALFAASSGNDGFESLITHAASTANVRYDDIGESV